jgi:hypothetical protein
MGTGYKPLQSVNYHDRQAHSYERSGVIAGLVGFWDGMSWLCLVSKSQWATVILLFCIHFLYDMCVNLIPGHTYYEHSVWPLNQV